MAWIEHPGESFRGMAIAAVALGGPAGAQAPPEQAPTSTGRCTTSTSATAGIAPLDEINTSNVGASDGEVVVRRGRRRQHRPEHPARRRRRDVLRRRVEAVRGQRRDRAAALERRDRAAVSRDRPRADLRRRPDLRVRTVDPVRDRREDRPHRRIVRQQRAPGDRACRASSSSIPTRTRPATS